MNEHCNNALKLAVWLEHHSEVEKVHYLGLESHQSHELAKKQQSGFGGIVSFEVKGGKEKAFKVINSTEMVSITANLGDTKTTITHPASTTHSRLSDNEKQKVGINDSLIRVSVGLESVDDVISDINKGLSV
jgi:O-succinylhomoserine sulfhydrylase